MSTFLKFGRVGGILLCEEENCMASPYVVQKIPPFSFSPFFSRLGGPPLLLILVLG
jgi:hypothetical protein